MRRTSLALGVLLVATNVAWFVAWTGSRDGDGTIESGDASPAAADPRVATLETKVRALERDLAAARRQAARAAPDGDVAAKDRSPERATPAAARPPARPAQPFDVRAAHEQAQAWLEALRSLDDPTAKSGAVQGIRAALAGDDAAALVAALRALAGSSDVTYDRTGLREAILRVLEAGEEYTTAPALYALFNTDRQDGDIDRVIGVVDAGYRGAGAVHLLALFGKRDLTGDTGRAALEVLDDLERDGQLRGQINGIWGASFSSEIEQKLLGMARSEDAETRRASIYFGLSTQANKSREVIDVLLEAAGGSDHGNRSRAFWGLGQGVAEDDYGHLAEGLGRLAAQRRDPQSLQSIRQILRSYSSPEGAEVLESLE